MHNNQVKVKKCSISLELKWSDHSLEIIIKRKLLREYLIMVKILIIIQEIVKISQPEVEKLKNK